MAGVPQQVKQKTPAPLTANKKLAAAGIAGGVFLLVLTCCTSIGTYAGFEFGVSRERNRVASETKDAINVVAPKLGGAKTVRLYKGDEKTAADVEGIKVAVIGAAIGKSRLVNHSGKFIKESEKSHVRVHLRIENTSDNFVVQYGDWNLPNIWHGIPLLADEFGNKYNLAGGIFFDGHRIEGSMDFKSRRIDPGKSAEEVVAFECPIDNAKKFTVHLPGDRIGKEGKDISLSLPRSFMTTK